MSGELSVDVTPWLTEEGVLTSLYIGTGCEPITEEMIPYEKLVDQSFESYMVGDEILERDDADVLEFVEKLEEVAAYARQRFEELTREHT